MLPIVAMLFAGCAGGGACADDETACVEDTAELDDPVGPATVRAVWVDCASSDGAMTWTYWAETDAWTSAAVLHVADASATPLIEQHTLMSTVRGKWGDHVERVLPVVGHEDYVADRNTTYTCDDATSLPMMWLIRVWDSDGELSDCVYWGDSPELMWDPTSAQYADPGVSMDECSDRNTW